MFQSIEYCLILTQSDNELVLSEMEKIFDHRLRLRDKACGKRFLFNFLKSIFTKDYKFIKTTQQHLALLRTYTLQSTYCIHKSVWKTTLIWKTWRT